jgi:chromosomal replication initiator protein
MWFWDLVNGVPRDQEPVSCERIMRAVSVFYGFSKIELCSIRRHGPLVRARQVAAFLCKTLTLRTLPDIARRLGGRDHTTILHAVRKIARLIETDAVLAEEVNALKKAIAS